MAWLEGYTFAYSRHGCLSQGSPDVHDTDRYGNGARSRFPLSFFHIAECIMDPSLGLQRLWTRPLVLLMM